ncbi:hypothetical protein CKA32_006044 [Geitlerinema sp. FC II]|nr:hypothetical protein CKA32_006044 [Geitlerinema sp. FC II]
MDFGNAAVHGWNGVEPNSYSIEYGERVSDEFTFLKCTLLTRYKTRIVFELVRILLYINFVYIRVFTDIL